MNRRRLYAAALLSCGFAIALGTPAYLGYTVPHLRGYLLHRELLIWQAAPYLLCAALWLPWRAPVAATSAFVLAVVMLLATIALYVPMLVSPRLLGGDMVGLSFMLVSVVASAAIGVISLLIVMVIWLRSHRRLASGPNSMEARLCRHCKQPIHPAARICQYCRNSQSWWASQLDPRFAVGWLVLTVAVFVPFMYFMLERSLPGEESVEEPVLMLSDASPRFVTTADGTHLFILGTVFNTSIHDASRIWFRVKLLNGGGKLIDSLLLEDHGLVVPSGQEATFRITGMLSVAQSEVTRTEVVVDRARAAGKRD
jgi:hypothetical protein